MNLKISKEWKHLGIVCLTAVVLMLPILVFGIPSGNDLPQHFQFAQAYYDSLTGGDGFPNWSARENFGYGSIGIRFYPPLSYYVLAFARMISGNWFDAAWLAFTFWMVLGCVGVYFWARWWMPPKMSALAGAFYAIIPYHLNQLYISFVYADFAGAAILPFCFAFQTRVFKRGKKSDVLGLAVFYALLVLTHLPSAIIGSMSLAVYALILLEKKKAFRQLASSAAAAFLGLAASSYYWLAMVIEMGWLNHATEKYQSGHYYFGNRFFPMYLSGTIKDNKDNLILSDIITSFCLLFLASAAVYFFYQKTENFGDGRAAQIFRFVLPLGLFAVFMATPLSYPVWKILTPLQKIQFPMRWMALVSMCGAIVTAATAYFLLKGEFLKKRSWIYASMIFLALFFIIDFTYMLYPSAFMPIERAQFEQDMRELPDKPNYVFWWAIWSKEDALKIKEKVLSGGRAVEIADWNPEQRSFTVEAGAPVSARIATFYYPRWKAEVNGRPVEPEKDENGALLIPLPAERSTVRLYFEEPSIVRASSLVSFLAWLFIVGSGLFLTAGAVFAARRPFEKLPEPSAVN